MPKNVFWNISEYTKIKDLTPRQLEHRSYYNITNFIGFT